MRLSFSGKFWLAYLLFIIAIIVLTARAFCADLHFTWTPNTDATQGYRLLMDGGTRVVQEIPGRESAETTFSAPDDGRCHSFALIAYAGDLVSKPSDFATWCPSGPSIVGKFILTIEPAK